MDDDFLIADILANTKVIMVGASANWKRLLFRDEIYAKTGVSRNPCKSGLAGQTLNGEMVYSSLAISQYGRYGGCFRRSEECPELAAQAAAIGAKTLAANRYKKP